MCARLLSILLAAFLIFNIITVVAFVYLPWWQAVIVVFGVVVVLLWSSQYLGRYLVRSTLRSALQATTALMEQQGHVLKNASVTVHSIRPAEMPDEVRELLEPDEDGDGPTPEELALAESLIWREIELTIFPDPSQVRPNDSATWNPNSLCLVPENWRFDATAPLSPEAHDDGSLALYQMRLIGPEGQTIDPSSCDVQGVQRLRFVVGVPRHLSTLALAYMTEKFGQIRLPPVLPPARPQ